jgi:hypothetical protein
MARTRLLLFGLVMAWMFPARPVVAAGPAPVTVHVFAAPSQAGGEAAVRARQDAVNLVIGRIEKSHKETLAIAERAEALIAIEITAIDVVTATEVKTTSNFVRPGGTPYTTKAYHITAILHNADSSTELAGESGFTWIAAYQVADSAAKWIAAHRTTLAGR